MSAPLRVAFVCTANISRSPWAEHRFRELVPGFEVVSAGVLAAPGRSMDPAMAALLPAVPTHSSRPVSAQLVASNGLILTMERLHLSKLIDEWPGAYPRSFVLGQFARTVQGAPGRLSLADLMTWTQEHRLPPESADDVADPYGRGAEAAQTCAAAIDGHLRVIAKQLTAAARR